MKFKKILCSILAVLMLCSMLSAFAYADETDDATVDTSKETEDAATEGESEEGEEGEEGETPKNEEIIISYAAGLRRYDGQRRERQRYAHCEGFSTDEMREL